MNKLICIDNLGNERLVTQIPGVRVVVVGEENVIKFHEGTKFERCEFVMNSNCSVTFAKTQYKIKNLRIFMNSFCKVSIEDDFSCLEAEFRLQENNTSIDIGKDCMFSSEIKLYASDGHAIFNVNDENKAINLGNTIRVGDHVWIGRSVCLLKNTIVGSNSIVGYGSVVTKTFENDNSLIVGFPAKIIKTGVNWDRKPPELYNRVHNKT